MPLNEEIAGNAASAIHKEDPHDYSVSVDNSMRHAYDLLCEVREASARTLRSRLAAAGFDDVSRDGLLLLWAIHVGGQAMRSSGREPGGSGSAARDLIRRLGITGQASGQALETLLLRGYLDFEDNPDDPRQPSVNITERGRSMLQETIVGVSVDRWVEFPFRSDDIIISTVKKSGTTWAQMICALLIFQSPQLPAPLPELSPWLDEAEATRSQMFTLLGAQRHRRFIKTHMPLDTIPIDPQVTYVVVARNPLDTAVSVHHQAELISARNAGGDHEAAKSPRQALLDHIDEMGNPQSYFDKQLNELSAAWERRDDPNVVLMHYEDMSADLAGEMRRLAGRLGITVPAAKWPGLVDAATFKRMRVAADQIQPLRNIGDKHASFFRKGSSGDGVTLLTSEEAARYRAHAAQVAPAGLLAWLHRDAGE